MNGAGESPARQEGMKMKVDPRLRAVIGIWSIYFINCSNDTVKFRIHNKIVKAWIESKTYVFVIEDYDLHIRAYGTDIVNYCTAIQKMLEG